MTFSTAANDTVEQRDFYETHTAYRMAPVHSTCAVQTNNLISKQTWK